MRELRTAEDVHRYCKRSRGCLDRISSDDDAIEHSRYRLIGARRLRRRENDVFAACRNGENRRSSQQQSECFSQRDGVKGRADSAIERNGFRRVGQIDPRIRGDPIKSVAQRDVACVERNPSVQRRVPGGEGRQQTARGGAGLRVRRRREYQRRDRQRDRNRNARCWEKCATATDGFQTPEPGREWRRFPAARCEHRVRVQ